jgi:hypothetical protein
LRSTIKPVLVLVFLICGFAQAQKIKSFEGIDASQVREPEFDVDPNGAVGTKQYMEWTNVYFQAYNKVSPNAPVWARPQSGTLPFRNNNMTNCTDVGGDGIVTFDHLALRWIIAVRSTGSSGGYYYCLAISNTDDLRASTLKWYTYQFPLNPVLGKNSKGHVFWPDWPKFGTWADAYYVAIDLNDVDRGYKQIGVVVCALDRINMLAGSQPRPMQCFSDPNPIPTDGSLYLRHSLIPADIDGLVAPPAGRHEYLVSIQNPLDDGRTTTSNSINLWDFHVDWLNRANSTFTNSALSVPSYTPACYNPKDILSTYCIPESTSKTSHNRVDSIGDRLMPRLAYRNFGTYESFLVSHTIRAGTTDEQTGIRWYELRGSGTPGVYQSGIISPDQSLFRFAPSIAQDSVGNAAAGYNASSDSTHPSIKTSWWSLSGQSQPKELLIFKGGGDEENSPHWGDYTSMTVDPVDDCTFWYVTQYFANNETEKHIAWNTRIGAYKASTCAEKRK